MAAGGSEYILTKTEAFITTDDGVRLWTASRRSDRRGTGHALWRGHDLRVGLRRREEVYMRDLCARIGHPEEPARGTTSAALTAYLAYHWGRRRLQVHQGIETGRPSRIETEVHEEGTIAIRGRAVRTLRGELMLPAFACRR